MSNDPVSIPASIPVSTAAAAPVLIDAAAAPTRGHGAQASPPPAFSSYQKFVVGVLAFLQFTIILDFMIISPLGAILLRDLHLPTQKFGLVVSVYAFSASISGLLAAGFADRFDRKKLLLFFYAGFTGGTLFCGLAPTYQLLLAARIVTGVFGGVIGSISMAIITDLFPLNMRGRVMGVVQTSFAASQVLGLPLGLYLANHWGWHAPFLMIVGLTVVAGGLIFARLQPIDAHLKLQREGNPFVHLFRTVSQRRYLQTFATTTLLATGGFMLMPFGSTFTINNLGIAFGQLPTIYLVTGLCTLVTGPFIGRLSDRLGKYRLFCAGTALTTVMVLIYTHLGQTALPWVIVINVLLFVGVTSRMISASALISGVPDPAHRGSFMSVNASLQQAAGGVGAAVAGLIVVQAPSGSLAHYDILGYVVVAAMLVVVAMLRSIDRMVRTALVSPRP
jgi:predicted MFS family arabinose efflux permease